MTSITYISHISQIFCIEPLLFYNVNMYVYFKCVFKMVLSFYLVIHNYLLFNLIFSK